MLRWYLRTKHKFSGKALDLESYSLDRFTLFAEFLDSHLNIAVKCLSKSLPKIELPLLFNAVCFCLAVVLWLTLNGLIKHIIFFTQCSKEFIYLTHLSILSIFSRMILDLVTLCELFNRLTSGLIMWSGFSLRDGLTREWCGTKFTTCYFLWQVPLI